MIFQFCQKKKVIEFLSSYDIIKQFIPIFYLLTYLFTYLQLPSNSSCQSNHLRLLLSIEQKKKMFFFSSRLTYIVHFDEQIYNIKNFFLWFKNYEIQSGLVRKRLFNSHFSNRRIKSPINFALNSLKICRFKAFNDQQRLICVLLMNRVKRNNWHTEAIRLLYAKWL